MKSLILLVLISLCSFANAQTAWRSGSYSKGQQCTYNRIIWQAASSFNSTVTPACGNRYWTLISGVGCPTCPQSTTTTITIRDTIYATKLTTVYLQDTSGYKIRTKGYIVSIDTVKGIIKYKP